MRLPVSQLTTFPQIWKKLGKIERSSFVLTFIFLFNGILWFVIMINTGSPILQHEINTDETITYSVRLEKGHYYRFFLKTNSKRDIRVWCTVFTEDNLEIISEYLSNYPSLSSPFTTRRHDKNVSFFIPQSGNFGLRIHIASNTNNPAWIIFEEAPVVLLGFPDDHVSMLSFVGAFVMFLLFILGILYNRKKLNQV
ncbi:MAG: hypothetical protein ACFFE8_10705 [Candidatus Heimdallarchaeota archaeon]